MRIGLVIYASIDTVSGGYLYDRKLIGYLRSRGDEVEIISLRQGSYAHHLLDNFSYRLPASFDVLIEDELVHPSLLLANRALHRSASGVGTPIVSLVHNLHSSERRAEWQNAFYRSIETRYLESADGFIFNSEVTRRSVTTLAGRGKPSVVALPGGDRLGSLSLEQVRERTSKSGPLRLLFLANVTPLKGLHTLLEALRSIPAETCVLDVVGSLGVDQPYAERMQRQAAALRVPAKFHGVLDGGALARVLNQADVLIHPSFYEGFGIVFLEGMAFGLPAIGTTAGAIPDLIEDGGNGYLIQPGDSAALAQILQRLASDRDLLTHLSLNARERFSTFPSWEQSAESIRSFLMGMIARGRSV